MTGSKKSKVKKADQHVREEHPQAAALMELHLAHELALFEREAFLAWLKPELELHLSVAREMPLSAFVDADQVKSVIARNVVDNEIPGAVAELAGDAAAQLFSSEMHKSTPLRDILPTAHFEEFVDKLLELPEQRKNGINHVIELPVYKDLISGVLYQAIIRYIYEENVLSKKVPGVASMLKFGKQMLDKTAPNLDGAVEENVRHYIAKNLVFILKESKAFLENSLTEEDIKTSTMELWDVLEDKTMSEFQQGMDSIDLSEFVVLGYEFWKTFRSSAYFRESYELVVDYFFQVYGESPLGTLLDDVMVTPDLMMREAEVFAPKVLEALKENGQIEQFLRRRLESFYFSKAALDCMSPSS
jgi:hypothetical protein